MKYFFFFLLVTAAAYAGSTLFLSYLDRETVKELPSHAPPPPEDSRTVAKRSLPPERKEDTSKKTSRTQEKPGLSSLNLKLLGTVVNEMVAPSAIVSLLIRLK